MPVRQPYLTSTDFGYPLTTDVIVDPNLINADGLHLGFGSYWDGIFQVPLSDPGTPASVCIRYSLLVSATSLRPPPLPA